jgi:hypothetical protein
MDCPRCGQTNVVEPSCPRCGIVFARWKPESARAPRSRPRLDEEPEPQPSAVRSILLPTALLVAVAAAAIATLRSNPASPVPSPDLPAPGKPLAALAQAIPPPPPPPIATTPAVPPTEDLKTEGNGFSDADRTMAEDLAARIQAGGSASAADVREGEQLLVRHPEDRGVRTLLQVLLLSASSQERRHRRYDAAISLLRRATEVSPDSARPWVALMDLLLETGDWPGAEAAARSAVGIAPQSAEAWRGLGYALLRQDRNREAADALRTSVGIFADPNTVALLARIEKGLSDEHGMTEQQLAHFHVRYDGGAHEDVGREILRALERHYSTLTSTLDHQPGVAIPVILFSQDAYYDASGAPAWSGGVYNHLDGRIRIPIGGLTSSLTPDIDDVLIHELTHAFVADRSKGVCPRDIHEGFAQYMEGKRLASVLQPVEIKGMLEGRMDGVHGFYYGALSFVEYLMAQRGQGGMNDLIKAMGETGNEDAAFRQVYGQDHAGMKRAWSARMRQEM